MSGAGAQCHCLQGPAAAGMGSPHPHPRNPQRTPMSANAPRRPNKPEDDSGVHDIPRHRSPGPSIQADPPPACGAAAGASSRAWRRFHGGTCWPRYCLRTTRKTVGTLSACHCSSTWKPASPRTPVRSSGAMKRTRGIRPVTATAGNAKRHRRPVMHGVTLTKTPPGASSSCTRRMVALQSSTRCSTLRPSTALKTRSPGSKASIDVHVNTVLAVFASRPRCLAMAIYFSEPSIP